MSMRKLTGKAPLLGHPLRGLAALGGYSILAAAICVATVLPSYADTTAPDFVTSEAVFWLDASALTETASTQLDSWADVRGGSYPGVTTYTDTKPQVIEIASGALAGKKAVTFFTQGTDCDMEFADVKAIRTFFMVADFDQKQHAPFLGGPTSGTGAAGQYRFIRGSNGTYQYNNTYVKGSFWNDGVAVANPVNTRVPTGYQLITWTHTADGLVKYLCSDRRIKDGSTPRNGGKRLCEVVAFSRQLSDYERSEVEAYLKAKWFGGMSQTSALTHFFVKRLGAQVHFDASVESSFHYDVPGDETGAMVSQWDDLSGNNNHFTANITNFSASYSLSNYGTRSEVGGKPVFDSGAFKSGIDLRIPAKLSSMTVFMVAEVDRAANFCWLGGLDGTEYNFAAGNGGQYAYNSGGSGIVKVRTSNGGEIWRNGTKVKETTSEYPELPGGLTVYSLRTTSAGVWCFLNQDRNCANRNGGKRVAELITFSTALSEADRATIANHLMDKWRPTEAYLDSLVASAPVHVDASSAAQFNYTDDAITGWKNLGDGADLVKPDGFSSGTYGFTNGVPAFLMGNVGSSIDLTFASLDKVRSVFWAMDIAQSQDAFFLGDSTAFNFHRNITGTPGAYIYGNHNATANVRSGTIACDGRWVAMTSERPPFGAHVYDVLTYANTSASSISCDRNDKVNRNGGRAISELLIFTNAVAGLTREAIRERIESKWTRSCGWAGAGDAEWGAGKYRVFGSDASVPTEGTVAAGVGFTANAILSGGTLTLGDGGIFASEGASVTVSAQVAGKLGVYGPGTVALSAVPATIDSISVGYGSTLTISAGMTEVAGGLSIQQNGKLYVDVSGLPAGQHAAIVFANSVLPAGGTLYDYVSLVGNTSRHILSVSSDGKTIHVNDPTLAVSAEWNGGTNDSATVAANWRCWNCTGEVLPNTTLPCAFTTNVVLNGGCNLTGWGTPVFADGVVIDLKGHVLMVANFSDDGYRNAVVMNSDAASTAELQVNVASGTTAVNSSAAVRGNVKIVKTGAGTWVAGKKGQSYTGGTEVRGGILKPSDSLRHCTLQSNYPFGGAGSRLIAAEGGTLDMNGMFAQGDAGYAIVIAGGTLLNGVDVSDSYGQMSEMVVSTDSTFTVNANCGMNPDTGTGSIDLGGRTLTVEIANGKHFAIARTTINDGVLALNGTGTGALQFGTSMCKNYDVAATDTWLRVNCAIAMVLNAERCVDVGGYEALYAGDVNTATNALNVHDTFKPAAHDYFYGVTMMDGSMIDLSARTNALPAVSSFTNGKRDLGFAENAVVGVKLGAWNVPPRSKIISWEAENKPKNVGTVKFVSGDEGRTRYFSKRRDGLYLSGGFVLIVK